MTFLFATRFFSEADVGVGGAMRRVGKEKVQPRRRRGCTTATFIL